MGNGNSKKHLKEKLLPAAVSMFEKLQDMASNEGDDLKKIMELSRSATWLIKCVDEMRLQADAFDIPQNLRPFLDEAIGYYQKLKRKPHLTHINLEPPDTASTQVSEPSEISEYCLQSAAEGLESAAQIDGFLGDKSISWQDEARHLFAQLITSFQKSCKFIVPAQDVGVTAVKMSVTSMGAIDDTSMRDSLILGSEKLWDDLSPIRRRNNQTDLATGRQNTMSVVELAMQEKRMEARKNLQIEKEKIRLVDDEKVRRERQKQVQILAAKERYFQAVASKRLMQIERQKVHKQEEEHVRAERLKQIEMLALRESMRQDATKRRLFRLEIGKRREDIEECQFHMEQQRQADLAVTGDWIVKKPVAPSEIEKRHKHEVDELKRARKKQAELVAELTDYRNQRQTEVEKLRGQMGNLVALAAFVKSSPRVPEYLQPPAMDFSWLAAPVGDPHYFHL